MNKALSLAVAATLSCASLNSEAQTMIGKTTDVAAIANGDRMNAETLWAMGRIGGAAASPDGKTVVYQVGYYSVKQNKSHQMLYTVSADGKKQHSLTTTAASETDATWIDGGKRIAFLTGGQLWSMNADGTDRRQLTKSEIDIEGYIFSPDEKKVILIKSLPYHESIKKNPDDLPLASGRLVTDLNYRHWDHYVETVAHPFVADVTADGIGDGTDIIEGEPFECPMAPFGGAEQLAWSPDSKSIAYTCRKKTGVDYATSTDSDIYLYDVQTGKTKNLCKPAGYKPLPYNPTKTKKDQRLNHQGADLNMGYDTNPQFSPDGKYVAWQSMKRDGYESDRNRLCVYNLLTGEKTYVAEKFDSNVDAFCWAPNSRNLYFIGCWHACVNMYQTDLNGDVRQLTDDWMDFGSLQMLGNTGKILASRHSISQADELYIITPGKDPKKTKVQQLTFENKAFYDQLDYGRSTIWYQKHAYAIGKAYDGGQFSELNCQAYGALYQDVLTVPGATLNWSLAHAGRDGTDTMALLIAPVDVAQDITDALKNKTTRAAIQEALNGSITVNGVNVPIRNYIVDGNISDGCTAWGVHNGTYTVPAGQ